MKIVTRYRCPTESRGARITAVANSGRRRRFTMAYDYSLDPAGNHDAAAWMLASLNGLEGCLMLSGETGRTGTRAHHFAAPEATAAA